MKELIERAIQINKELGAKIEEINFNGYLVIDG